MVSEQIRESAPPLTAKWEPIIGVRVQDFYVRRMKTKWGSTRKRTFVTAVRTWSFSFTSRIH
ncbi:MAG TPA: YgjP-like metallopeptidase domain-containing protein, partial [Pyrinomonadaceae bacterium]|nr:YgjP-like metallopeptidase domain-containing protein [Pyrinomonadaceae bacterium]